MYQHGNIITSRKKISTTSIFLKDHHPSKIFSMSASHALDLASFSSSSNNKVEMDFRQKGENLIELHQQKACTQNFDPLGRCVRKDAVCW